MIYIIANLVVMTALTLIMGLFMQRCNHLLIAFWIYFCVNFSFRFLAGDVYFFAILAVLYVAVALTLVGFFRRSEPTPSVA